MEEVGPHNRPAVLLTWSLGDMFQCLLDLYGGGGRSLRDEVEHFYLFRRVTGPITCISRIVSRQLCATFLLHKRQVGSTSYFPKRNGGCRDTSDTSLSRQKGRPGKDRLQVLH